MDEGQLILLARRGDDSAWAEIIHMHQHAVFRLAYLYLGDAAEAEDAAQDCLIRAYRNLGRFEQGRPLRPWLLRIVSNLALNRRRSMGRYWAALQRAARDEPTSQAGVHSATDTQQEAETLWAAVKKLPHKMQSVIYLRYFLDFSIEECAQVLGLAEGTVKSQTHRALDRLQDIIRREFPVLEEGRN